MKKKSILSETLAAVAACLFAVPAFGQTILLTQDDFQSYTANALLPTAAVSGTHGAYSYAAAPGQIFVAEDPLNSANKAARVARNGTGNTYLYASALAGTIKTFDQLSAAGQGLLFSYDIYVSGANLNQSYVQLQYGNSGSSPLATVYFKAPSGGTLALDYLVAGTGATSSGFTASANTWYTLTYDVHQLVDDQWAVSIAMKNKSTGATIDLLSDKVASISDTSVNSFLRATFFQTGTLNNENFSLIDNISLYAVPEPATFGLAGCAVFAFLLRRRFKS